MRDSQRCRKGVKSSLNECNLIDSYPQRILLIPLLGLGQTVFSSDLSEG
jgi:hypothetical protein